VLLSVGVDANDQTYFKGAPFYIASSYRHVGAS
jgi:hypothetical protein